VKTLLSLSSLALSLAFLTACGSDPEPSATMAQPATIPQLTMPAAQVGQKMTTASGLQYEVLRVGTGARPFAYDRVRVHYHGYLPNGTVFDSSVDRGEPISFDLDKVIAGWTEGLQLMQEGAQYRFTIPSGLAYGVAGSPPKIGPNQTLMFDVELIQVIR